jgi:hypothetical protein
LPAVERGPAIEVMQAMEYPSGIAKLSQ